MGGQEEKDLAGISAYQTLPPPFLAWPTLKSLFSLSPAKELVEVHWHSGSPLEA